MMNRPYSFFYYDSVGVEKTSIQDLNFPKIAAYFDRYEVDFSAEEDKMRLLQNVDILTSEEEATIAGLLLFGTAPQRWLHNDQVSKRDNKRTGAKKRSTRNVYKLRHSCTHALIHSCTKIPSLSTRGCHPGLTSCALSGLLFAVT